MQPFASHITKKYISILNFPVYVNAAMSPYVTLQEWREL